MKCPRCANEIVGNTSFCSNCGFDLRRVLNQNPNNAGVYRNNLNSQNTYANNNGYNNYNLNQNYQAPGNQGMYNNPYAFQSPNNNLNQPPEKKTNKTLKALLISGIAVFVTIAIIVSAIAIAGGSGGSLNRAKADSNDYTLMIYMIGSDLESQGGFASNDLREMLASNVELDNLNVIVYAGGAASWSLPISNKNKNYLKLVKDDNGSYDFEILESSEPAENMSAPSALSGFLNYCYKNYPAGHYGLICWDHGAGIVGFGQDELYQPENSYDTLTLDEMQTAFENSPFDGREKLDFIGFDACLMSTVEVAEYLSPYADYMVGSEDIEAGSGWDYGFMPVFNRTTDALEISKSIVNSFESYYNAHSSELLAANGSATLSVCDLSKINVLYDALIDYLDTVDSLVSSGDFSVVSQNCGNIRGFRIALDAMMFDVVDTVEATSLITEKESEAVKKAVKEVVVVNSSRLDRCSGLSFYYDLPMYYMDQGVSAYQIDGGARSVFAEHYSDAAQTIRSVSQANKVSWELGEVKNKKDYATLTLTDDQLSDMAAAYFNVLVDTGDEPGEVYTPLMLKYQIIPDENGVLSVPLDAPLISAVNSYDGQESSSMIWPVKQTSVTKTDRTYETVGMVSNYSINDIEIATSYESINMSFIVNNDNELSIRELSSDSEFLSLSNKNNIKADEWLSIYCAYSRYAPSKKPIGEWAKDGWVFINGNYIGNDISFVPTSTKSCKGSFAAQIVVVNRQGKSYATDLFDLYNQYSAGVKKATVETENGKLFFDIHNDGAVLTGYSGGDTEISVPSTVEGAAVKKIGASVFGSNSYRNESIESIKIPDSVESLSCGSFAYMSKLAEIELPKGLKEIPDNCFFQDMALEKVTIPNGVGRIGRFAFGGSGIKSLDIPDSVTELGVGFIRYCTSLTGLTVAGKTGGTNYKVVNGIILMTADGKEIVASAMLPKDSAKLEIPEGTEKIRDFAFYATFNNALSDGNHITDLVLPEGLKYIGDFAFCLCDTLKEINLPDSLETIGESAFGALISSSDEEIENVNIGKNLKKLGVRCFSAYNIKAFTVDKNNGYFASVDGKLMNKGGDREIEVLAKEYEKFEPTGTYYDMKGNTYPHSSEVLYYDRDGNTYVFKDSEFRYSENDKPVDGYPLIDTEGYLVIFDSYSDVVSAQLFEDKGIMFYIKDVRWNSKGELTANDYSDDEYFDRDGNKYKKQDEVPYYTEDGQEYHVVLKTTSYGDYEYSSIDVLKEKTSGNIVSKNEVFVNSDGYLVITRSSLGEYIKTDMNGNIYYSEYSVYWNSEGDMIGRYNGKVIYDKP